VSRQFQQVGTAVTGVAQARLQIAATERLAVRPEDRRFIPPLKRPHATGHLRQLNRDRRRPIVAGVTVPAKPVVVIGNRRNNVRHRLIEATATSCTARQLQHMRHTDAAIADLKVDIVPGQSTSSRPLVHQRSCRNRATRVEQMFEVVNGLSTPVNTFHPMTARAQPLGDQLLDFADVVRDHNRQGFHQGCFT